MDFGRCAKEIEEAYKTQLIANELSMVVNSDSCLLASRRWPFYGLRKDI